jgi:hypothetical protein
LPALLPNSKTREENPLASVLSKMGNGSVATRIVLYQRLNKAGGYALIPVEYSRNGSPAADKRATAFYLRFRAGGKPNQSGIGYLVSFLSKEFEPYEGTIWDEQSAEELAEEFGAIVDPVKKELAELKAKHDAQVKAAGGISIEEIDRIVAEDAKAPAERSEAPAASHAPSGARGGRRPRPINEENWGGLCKGGCGEYITGQFVCNKCKAKAAEKNFALNPGEHQIYRGNEGEPSLKIVKQVVVIGAADGDIEDISWLWPNKIPLGCATWCMGQPNNAKSLMTCAITACVTTGKDFPDGSANTVPASRVLMYSGEDSLSKIVRPRLLAHGADLTKVQFLDRKSFRTIAGDNEPEKRPLDLSQDCGVLLAAVKANPDIKLIIADPITGIFGQKSINKNEEANPIFEQLIDFCEASGIAFLGVLHVPKRTTNSSIEKIAGGTAVAANLAPLLNDRLCRSIRLGSQFRLVYLQVEPLEALAACDELRFAEFDRHAVPTLHHRHNVSNTRTRRTRAGDIVPLGRGRTTNGWR